MTGVTLQIVERSDKGARGSMAPLWQGDGPQAGKGKGARTMAGNGASGAGADPVPPLIAHRERLLRASTAERVAEVLSEQIAEGAFPPGTRLSEDAISRGLGVSRNTLREAFRLLVHERLVVHEMNRGVFVRVPTPEDIVDLFKLRRLIETAGLMAADGTNLGPVLDAVQRGEAGAAEGNWGAVATADLHFHQALTALLGSQRVDELIRTAMAELRLAFHMMGTSADFHGPYLRRNRAMVDLLAKGKKKQANEELLSYLADAEDALLEASTAALSR